MVLSTIERNATEHRLVQDVSQYFHNNHMSPSGDVAYTMMMMPIGLNRRPANTKHPQHDVEAKNVLMNKVVGFRAHI